MRHFPPRSCALLEPPADPVLGKRIARRDALDARASLPLAYRLQADRLVCARLLQLPAVLGAHSVALYLSRAPEVDTWELASQLRCRGQRVLAPRAIPCSRDLIFHALDSGAALRTGPFGIAEPDPASCGEPVSRDAIDVVIAPVVAFDASCRRIGMGKGYYDRFLAGCPLALSIGLAYEIQRVDAIPVEPHDRPLALVATEIRWYGDGAEEMDA
ncbi:MAG: 5-formyltetrahydrofolate cyclo-ligase [Candidatus Schekmanbacteria bacterium]|nr:5-formyltetrahydrofolate cyclo-ligase [Candidatus Schekmanbacteria bacterium]